MVAVLSVNGSSGGAGRPFSVIWELSAESDVPAEVIAKVNYFINTHNALLGRPNEPQVNRTYIPVLRFLTFNCYRSGFRISYCLQARLTYG